MNSDLFARALLEAADRILEAYPADHFVLKARSTIAVLRARLAATGKWPQASGADGLRELAALLVPVGKIADRTWDADSCGRLIELASCLRSAAIMQNPANQLVTETPEAMGETIRGWIGGLSELLLRHHESLPPECLAAIDDAIQALQAVSTGR